MAARTLTRDLKWKNGVHWKRGETYDLSWADWSAVCSDLGVTLPEISYEAGEAEAKLSQEVARLEKESAALRAELDALKSPKPKTATNGKAKETD